MVSENTVPAEKRSVLIDATTEGEPISQYIYSQFIEHLGRCIYGGIWAEMLDDRKFFDGVGSEASPWSVTGSGGVDMDAVNPFVGEHTPCVSLPGNGTPAGIAQSGLTVVAGRSYVGRIWVSGDTNATPVEVSLIWGDGDSERQTITIGPVGEDYVKAPLQFTAGRTTDNARFEVVSRGSGRFRVGTASLMPADNIRGMRPDTLDAMRELDSPLYRWPGGNFVSGYDWRDGIGDPDRRPPRKNPAWRGVEHNDFGMHEFLDFCRELNTEPLIVVNTGFGDAHSAAQEVEYVNGTANTPMGQWRAANGRVEPWAVEWWGVGNEMFGPWQLGFMAVEQYVLKHKDFERSMRKVDPTIRTIGVGESGPWSEAFMAQCGGDMDLISEHFYCKDKADVIEHVAQIPSEIRRKVEDHRRYRKDLPALKGRDVRIAMDEWNYWYGPDIFGELGVRYFWKDALGIAAGLHEFFRQSDMVFMANYAQTVNVLGCIKTTPTAAALESAGLVLKLYRQKFGVIPVKVETGVNGVDVSAALTADRKALTVGVVNASGVVQTMAIQAKNITASGAGTVYKMACDDVMALNDPGKDPVITIEERGVTGYNGSVTVEPYSVTIYVLDVAA
ncbi:MAG TPA: alpha-L-arabinofuranosidase C-terminal domain-containing protein [Armatimonadota bacterium]|jgi:alpha-N-arabinofuranosidase